MAVVFPAPGGPIITYQGSTLSCRRPPLLRRSATIAVFSLPRSSASSLPTTSSPVSTAATISSPKARSRRRRTKNTISMITAKIAKITPAPIARATRLSKGRQLSEPMNGPK